MRADHVDTQHRARLRVGDDLGEPLAGPVDQRLRHGLERHPADRHGKPALGALRLGEAHGRDLRPGVRGARLGRVVHRVDVRHGLARGQVCRDQALVRRRVREHQPAHDVADRPEVRHARAHVAVHADEPALRLDARGVQAQPLRVGGAAGRHQQDVRGDLLARAAVRAHREADPGVVHHQRGGVEAGGGDDADAAPLEGAGQLSGDLRVLQRHERREVLEERDLDAQVVERGGELGANGAGAHHHDGLRE